MSVIRAFTGDDSLSELTDLLHAAYAQLGALGFNYTAVDQSVAVTRERMAGGECYVAEEDGRLVGTVLFHDAAHSGGCAWYDRAGVSTIHQLGILPALRGRGMGGALLSFAESRARASGAEEVALDTSEGAAHLLRWYRSRDYREVGHVQWDGKTYRSVIMSKALEQ